MDEHRTQSALVVEDDPIARVYLSRLLRRAGYDTSVAVDGEEAVAIFRPGMFDIVLMDMYMPGLGGLEATRRIKAASGEIFTPVVFVTGESSDEGLASAIDAGGDDFLVKPVGEGVLRAKLRAMERIRRLHARARTLYERVLDDQEIAREVFDRAVSVCELPDASLRSLLLPAEVFSGDLLLAAFAPDRTLHVLFGDFTGHGLAAALGAMPVASTFRAMVGKGFAACTVVEELNRKVFDMLPRGHFLAATYLCVGHDLASAAVANCGMPPLYVCNGAGVRDRVDSGHFSLGIVRDVSFAAAFRRIAVERGERLLLASDGVAEAIDEHGGIFGDARLAEVIADSCRDGIELPAAISAALDRFRGNAALADDVSIAEIRLEDRLFATGAPAATARAADRGDPGFPMKEAA